jgi:uncharacterized protein (TIGR03083 family)
MTIMAVAHGIAAQAVQEIPALTHAEAYAMAQVEAGRVLALIETLTGEDWARPTYCTAWDVRAMVAHLAGACAGFASWQEFRRQYLFNPYVRTEPMQVDGVNRRQIEDRAGRTPAELVAEFRHTAPLAARTRFRLPWLLRKLRIPFGPPLGTVPVEYLTSLIYPRDQWMHRVDICAATGKLMTLTPDHDARMVARVVRDVPGYFGAPLPAVELVLTGPAGGTYHFGTGAPVCSIEIDACDFCLRASGRIDVDTALAAAQVYGDVDIARHFFTHAIVPF